jgi:transcriptional regulator with XRE-family HTH domain
MVWSVTRADQPSTDELAHRFGENLLRLRRSRGLSQTELGDRTEMHRNDISLIERGRRRPRVDVLIKVARVLEVTPADLLDGITWIPSRRPKTAGSFKVSPKKLPSD